MFNYIILSQNLLIIQGGVLLYNFDIIDCRLKLKVNVLKVIYIGLEKMIMLDKIEEL